MNKRTDMIVTTMLAISIALVIVSFITCGLGLKDSSMFCGVMACFTMAFASFVTSYSKPWR